MIAWAERQLHANLSFRKQEWYEDVRMIDRLDNFDRNELERQLNDAKRALEKFDKENTIQASCTILGKNA